jgi:hypothetical protein
MFCGVQHVGDGNCVEAGARLTICSLNIGKLDFLPAIQHSYVRPLALYECRTLSEADTRCSILLDVENREIANRVC